MLAVQFPLHIRWIESRYTEALMRLLLRHIGRQPLWYESIACFDSRQSITVPRNWQDTKRLTRSIRFDPILLDSS